MSNIRKFLWVWIVISFLAAASGGYIYIQEQGEKDDVSVSTAASCAGGCLYYGVRSDYPVGMACRGLQPGDPDGQGGTWAGEDYSNKCYVCGSNGAFTEQSLSSCNKCYANTLQKPGGGEFTNGTVVANGPSAANMSLFRCNMGKWEAATQPKCVFQCKGDQAFSLYGQGHTCVDPRGEDIGFCWVCEDPKLTGLALVNPQSDGSGGQYGGMNFYPMADSKCNSVRPTTEVRCPAVQCVGDSVARTYLPGELCQSLTSVPDADYGTYVCGTDGTWARATGQKCLWDGDLFDQGEAKSFVGKCYQCLQPGTKLGGGFQEVDPINCPDLTPDPGIECTPEVKVCGDGSTVTRNPSKTCAFDDCPSTGNICTQDLKICADGSYVGRDPANNCAFRACTTGNTTCTLDAKVCPSGVEVGRDPNNNCEFFACPTANGDKKTCYSCDSVQSICSVVEVENSVSCDGTGNNFSSIGACATACLPGASNEIPPHGKAGACLGDLNGQVESIPVEGARVGLNDFALFGQFYGKVLTGTNRYLDLKVEGTDYTLNLLDFATFGKNYGKNDTNCIKRESDIVLPN